MKLPILFITFLLITSCGSSTDPTTDPASGASTEAKIYSPMITVWRTTTLNETITLPLRSGYQYDFSVDWGDGSANDQITTSSDVTKTHTYATPGDYTVTITGLAESWYFNNGVDKDKIISVTDFGNPGWIDLNSAFKGCSNLESFTGGVTSDVTSMRSMFTSANSLSSINLSSFDTSKVTDMNSMFYETSSLINLDLSSFDTSNVTSMADMFYGCSSLTSLDVSSFDTSSVRNMSYMFDSTSSLTSLNVSSFNTENVTNTSYMFYANSSLTSLDLSSFNTANVTDMRSMFRNSSSLTSLNLSSFNTASVADMSHIFRDASSLTTLNLTNWDTSNVGSFSNVFTAMTGTILCNDPDNGGVGADGSGTVFAQACN